MSRESFDSRFGMIHYTSVGVLASMLTRLEARETPVSLRAYDAVHFNDPNEGRLLTGLIPGEYEWLKTSENTRAFVTSFVISKDADDCSDNLMFWRHYGREGEGCSLSIPLDNENGEAIRQELKTVKYGTNPAQDTMRQIVRILEKIKPLVDHKNFRDSGMETRLYDVVSQNFDRLRYLYKHEAYEHENECRLVINQQDTDQIVQFEYHEGNTRIPKIKGHLEPAYLNVRKMFISESVITLGPTIPQVNYMAEDLKKYLSRMEIYGVDIKISELSYRKN